ncbi:MAG: pseudouridine synthase [Chitinophagaceae bacterium]
MPHTYLFYKPFQVLSQFSPEGTKKTLADFFQGIGKDVYPVGRLDYDSEGLLLLSNDKTLTHRLLEPRFGHKRTYYVQVEGTVSDEALHQLNKGVTISVDGKQHATKPAIAKRLPAEPELPERNPPIRFRKNIPTSWISLTITEGKNRQVRKMTAAVGFPTLRLVRYSVGELNIQEMLPGTWRELSGTELALLGL